MFVTPRPRDGTNATLVSHETLDRVSESKGGTANRQGQRSAVNLRSIRRMFSPLLRALGSLHVGSLRDEVPSHPVHLMVDLEVQKTRGHKYQKQPARSLF